MTPFVYLSDTAPHCHDGWEDGVGVQSIEMAGVHAIFAARIPFIPAFRSDDFRRRTTTEERNRNIVGRQVRFINDLANVPEQAATFDLRFVVRPDPGAQAISAIHMVLLGKVFHQDERSAKNLAMSLWRKVRSHFPSEDPYNYPLEPIVDEEDLHRCLEPIPLQDLNPGQIVEVRKYMDHDPYVGDQQLLGFFPHSFLPNLKYSALGGLMEAMARQTRKCAVSISLKPIKLFKGELMALMQMLNTYSVMATEGEGWMKLHRQERLEDLLTTYWPLINQRHHLFSVKIQVIGEAEAPSDVVHALGSELMDNTTEEPRLWSAESPGNRQELELAVHNFRYLEHAAWGEQQTDARAKRLRFLCSAYEAAGAFRLPIPSESGYLPGIQVRDEAFVVPSTSRGAWNGKALGETGPALELGEIIHRGARTGIPFSISLQDLKRHALVAGATGSGKTNTCLHLLSQLWAKYHIPFLVIYPIDKPDYRLLMADPQVRDDLLIFTLGDETCAPFRFNPLYVPPGILLKTHISQLMRSFEAAFALWEPLPRVYRDALYRVYRAHGWDVVQGKGGDSGPATPTLADLYDYLVQAAHELTAEYGGEVKGNIRQATEIRMRDLLQNAGSVINVPGAVSLADILQRPVVMELGRVGSSEDIALVMGFLLTGLVEELGSAQKYLPPRERDRQHITLVEEGHRLMAAGHSESEFRADPRAKGGEDFANVLAEVRGLGEGIMIAEQMPTSLVVGAMGNTQVKIMHRLEETASFSLFADILNLDQRQREYVRALSVGQAIVRDSSGQPVHVQVANYKDQYEYPDDRPRINDSDESVRAFMEGRMTLPPAITWQPPVWGQPCCWCRVKCQYGTAVGYIPPTAIGEDAPPFGNAAFRSDWPEVRKIGLGRVEQEGLRSSPDAAYCWLARIAASQAKDGRSNFEAYAHVRAALENFH